jgi:DNA-binding response OmpR family regulator
MPPYLLEGPANGPMTENWGMALQPRVIVVDDEPELCRMVADYLARHGLTIRTATGGAGLDAHLEEEDADLLILDLNMPGEDGFAVARRIRATSPVPILMLTAADDVVDRIVGLELGADDYMTKPFDLRELRARVRALLRRSAVPVAAQSVIEQASAAATPASSGGRIRFGVATLDVEARCLVHDDGTELHLTAMEFELLHVFAQNPNRVLTRDRLLDLAHRNGSDPFDRSIDIRVTRIRRKVEADPAKPVSIKTVRGAGYMYVPPPA